MGWLLYTDGFYHFMEIFSSQSPPEPSIIRCCGGRMKLNIMYLKKRCNIFKNELTTKTNATWVKDFTRTVLSIKQQIFKLMAEIRMVELEILAVNWHCSEVGRLLVLASSVSLQLSEIQHLQYCWLYDVLSLPAHSSGSSTQGVPGWPLIASFFGSLQSFLTHSKY